MKYKARFSSYAKEDKNEIKTYLSKFYPKTPHRFITLLKEYIDKLKDNPYLYPVYPDRTDYRRMFVGNYIVFYKVNEAEKKIDIYRILRASWDLSKHL